LHLGALNVDNRRMSRIVMVVPCYNEAGRLDAGQFLHLQVEGHRVELLFVNDGSGDGTLAMLEMLRSEQPGRIAVLDLERNSGKAEAVRRGFGAAMASSPDYVGFWDADLATPFAELPGFVRVLESNTELQMVFGARVKLLGRVIDRHPQRHYLGRVAATLISLTLGIAIYDSQCGAKLFRMSPTLREVFGEAFLSRWIFDVEIIARFMARWGRDETALRIYELPLRQWKDVQGSKVTAGDFLKALRDLWRIRNAYRS
jgi:dolichyl-phosphate beta-glucosyltransferase